MKKWQIQQPDEAAAKNIQANSDLSLFCAELLTVRGYRTIEETASQFSCPALSDPFLIRDMQAAADCLNAAIDSGEKICVYGDYDCDGVMATVILYSYLMELGADVVYYIPERSEGYGMNLNALETLKAQGVSLIVTVDNGIAALEEADWIAEQGMRLVITDHHQPYSTLPAAVAVVDPHRVDCPSPFSLFCGAGLALKLVAAMDGGDMTFALEQFGDLAAIATVADVVSLTGENRFLVQQGLRLLANTERPGLLALLELTGMQGKTLTATNLAFTLAPRINAAGRFGSPKLAVSLLLAETMEEAMPLAKQLEQCNRQRKEAEADILQEIQEHFDLSHLREFTVEAGRPDTITEGKLRIMEHYGVDRISINPQTMKQDTLDLIGRAHTVDDVEKAFALAKKGGPRIINTDLIAGLPGEDFADFKRSLDRIVELGAENITLHTLAVKRASRLKEMDGEFNYRNEELREEMLSYAMETLRAKGYRPYYLYRQKHTSGNTENIGFCRDDAVSVYNIRIMEEAQSILALGAGGISKIWFPAENRLERVANVSNYEIYIDRLDEMMERKKNGFFGKNRWR